MLPPARRAVGTSTTTVSHRVVAHLQSMSLCAPLVLVLGELQSAGSCTPEYMGIPQLHISQLNET